MRIEVPHMYGSLDDAFANLGKTRESTRKSEHWTDDHMLTRITLEDAVYTGNPLDTMGTSDGILIGWQQGYGKYVFEPAHNKPKSTEKTK